jgi:transposase
VDDLLRERRHQRPRRTAGTGPGQVRGLRRRLAGRAAQAFREGIELVVIDPSAPYAAGVRAALPHARIAVDKWHLVALANQMVTEVRQRVTRERLGRRGTTA